MASLHDASVVVSPDVHQEPSRVLRQDPLQGGSHPLQGGSHPLQELNPNITPLQDLNPGRVAASCPPRFRPPTPYNHNFDDTYYQPPPAVSSLPTIPKLSGKNYRSWATNVELILRRHQVWSFVRDVPPPTHERSHAWDEKDLLARSEIMWSCEPSIQDLLSHCSTAKECWDVLRREFTVRDYIEVHQMVDEFNSVSKLPGESCKQFIERVRLLADELATTGRPLANEDIAYRLLFGLPEDYRQLRTSIISNRTDDHILSTIRIIPAILSEERYLLNTSHAVEAPTTVAHLIWVVHKSHGGNRYCIDVAVCAGESKRGKGRKGRIGGLVLRARRSCIGGFCN